MHLSDPPARSYYAASLSAAQVRTAREPLAGETQVDVAVVGGGIAGISAALHLSQRGYRVALLEAREIGYGASGRSGGQTIFGLATPQQTLIKQVGRDDARRLFDLSIAGLKLTQQLIHDHKIDCDYRPNHIHVAVKARQLQELEQWSNELREQNDYRSVQLLNRNELQSHISTDQYLGGLLDTQSGHLHPLKYTLGLAQAAERAGTQIFENTQVLNYSNGNTVTIHTAKGRILAKHLVLCGNAYLNGVAPLLAKRILGVGTYIIATEPLSKERALKLLPSNAAIADLNWIVDYFRLSADTRVLFGGRVSYSALEPPNVAESMRKRMLRIFPTLADVKVQYTWGGFLDITMSRAPNFGRLAPNVFYLQGFSGHGMTLTALSGQLVAEALAGTAERFDVFARIPHRDFPGGAYLRRPSLMLAMLYYRLRDLL